MTWFAWAALTLAGAALSWSDQRTLSVPTIGVLGFWLLAAVLLVVQFPDQLPYRLAGSGLVLVLGGLLIKVTAARWGEADVLCVSALTLATPFWPLLVSVGLGCCAAVVSIFSLPKPSREVPVPFLPSLFWAWSAVSLWELVSPPVLPGLP